MVEPSASNAFNWGQMLASAVILAVVLSAFSPMSLRCQDSPSGLANLWGRVKYFHPDLAYRQEGHGLW